MKMAKQYGLIIPGKQKRVEPPKSNFTKPSIFGESSSDSDDDRGPPQLKMKSAPIGPGATEKRLARKIQEKALEEDPTIFQYDELYDEIENKREEAKKAKSNEVKKPKYIARLLECAEKRKLDNERRIERMVQKEREQEGEEFKDKESFVTSAYRKKLEDMQKAEEQEKREEYLESIGDVTKQKDLDGFYRHLYEQKLGPKESTTNPAHPQEAGETSAKSDEVSYKPIKSGKSRAYRKRRSSAEEEPENTITSGGPGKRAHIQSNLDADSDFSIDSSSSEDEGEYKKESSDKANKAPAAEAVVVKEEKLEEEAKDIMKVAENDIKLEIMKKEKSDEEDSPPAEAAPPKPKKDKSAIWKKRTVGEVFDAALQRYFERKAARSG